RMLAKSRSSCAKRGMTTRSAISLAWRSAAPTTTTWELGMQTAVHVAMAPRAWLLPDLRDARMIDRFAPRTAKTIESCGVSRARRGRHGDFAQEGGDAFGEGIGDAGPSDGLTSEGGVRELEGDVVPGGPYLDGSLADASDGRHLAGRDLPRVRADEVLVRLGQ